LGAHASIASPARRRLRAWRQRLAGIAFLGSLLLLVAMGCQRQPPRIVLAVNPWPGYGYFALAKARSHYDVHRINLDLRNFADPAATMEAYISGGAQAIATTTIDAVAICGVAPDRCPVIVFVIDESRGADQVLVRQGVKDLKDLADQPIALDRSSLSRYVLSRAFESVGLPPPQPSQLRFLPAASWEAALRRGEAQAVVTYPPRSEQLLRALPMKTLFTSRQLPYEVLDVLAVEPELLRLHPDAVLALVQGWQAMREEETQRPASVRQAMADYLGLDSGAAAALRQGIRFPGRQEQYELLDPAQNNLPPLLEKIRKVLYANGVIPANTPLPTTVDSIAKAMAKQT